jgi:hypothetical protein
VLNLLSCRRGSVALATVIALVPLIGVVAFGAEAGSWYVIRQHAQNAADAAAYSGGLQLACSLSGGGNCDTAHDYVYRGKQFADQNKFCDPRDTSSLYSCANSPPTGTTQTVQIDQPTAVRVRARVSQQQPVYLAKVLGLFPDGANIGAQAIVEVTNPKDLCALGLGPSAPALTIGGSSAIQGNGCALMSDTSVKYNSTPNLSGPGWAVDAVGGCKASTSHCDLSDIKVPFNYNMLPAANPLKKLDDVSTAPFNTRTGNTGSAATSITCPALPPLPNGSKCYKLQPNDSSGAYTGNFTWNNKDNVTFAAPGTYFFYNASISMTGANVSGAGVNIVLLGNSSLSINGGTVNLSALSNNTTYPILSGVLIDDQSTGAVNITGNGTVALGGAMYFPKADVTYNGTVQNTSTAPNTITTCAQVIGKTLTMGGNLTYLSTQGCAPGTVAKTQVVALVQ